MRDSYKKVFWDLESWSEWVWRHLWKMVHSIQMKPIQLFLCGMDAAMLEPENDCEQWLVWFGMSQRF